MFGYIMINKPELKVREYNRYHAYYCGMCHQLKEKFGRGGQIALNYDMVFMAALLTGLYEGEETISEGRCFVHPLAKHEAISNTFVDYAADMTILLGYYDRLDGWEDEREVKALLTTLPLKRKVKRLKHQYPRQYKAVQQYLSFLHQAEKAGENALPLDEISGYTGNLLAEIFCIKEDVWSATLKECGFYLGKFIYLLDAYEDMEKDREKGLYNPLLKYKDMDGFEEWFLNIMNLTMASCAGAFERLPVVKDAEIIRNILYSGVWIRYEKARLTKMEQKENKNGSI